VSSGSVYLYSDRPTLDRVWAPADGPQTAPVYVEHCRLTGQYLNWAGNQPTAKYWWCRPYRTQTHEHVLKNCPHWKTRQEILWAEIRKDLEDQKGEGIRDLFTDARCSQAVLDFLSTTDVGRLIPAPAEEDDRARRRSGNSRRATKRGVEIGGRGAKC